MKDTDRMNYVDATDGQMRNDGAIKLHGPEAFEGMRKAGQLSARALDMLVEYVKPGVTTQPLACTKSQETGGI